MNVFNAINFDAVAQAGSGATVNQVTESYQDPNVTFDPGGRDAARLPHQLLMPRVPVS